VARLAGVKARVVHFGTYPWHWQSNFWKYRLLTRLGRPVTSSAICVTEHVRRGVIEHFGNVAARIDVVANGIDLRRFNPDFAAVKSARRSVLMVGRVDGTKDHATLIEAVHALSERKSNVVLRIAGDGEKIEPLRKTVAAQGIDQIVEFLGPRSDIPELLAQADVFAFSVRPEEGLGIALVEAMAAGVPVVASDVGACREVLDNGTCGLLVEPGNAIALADGIERLLRDRDLAGELARRARARVEAVYDRRVMARRYAEICGLA
jgi:glycosyltransferase involved in cell wall biosynthesis